ncbi:MAG TPA: hypothetical protein PLV87_12590, partial [Opitutaceae bacterium]|nr:hypothetical protein [Opitutaceae bacterium]
MKIMIMGRVNVAAMLGMSVEERAEIRRQKPVALSVSTHTTDSNLIEMLAVDNAPFVVTRRTNEDERDLLTRIETKSTSPNTAYTKFSYTYDARRYRSTALQEGTAFADYGDATYRQFAYNGRGELTAGIGY